MGARDLEAGRQASTETLPFTEPSLQTLFFSHNLFLFCVHWSFTCMYACVRVLNFEITDSYEQI